MITASRPAQSKPNWSQLQSEARLLGTTPDGRTHLDGVRWDIVNNPDGTCQEKGVFGDVFFDPNDVKDVYLGVKPFTDKPGGQPGHAQLHFDFKKPVSNSQGQTDRGLVMSVEIHFEQGGSWQPIGPGQPTLYQVCTWSDAIEKSVDFHNYPLQLYRLKLDHEQQVALLKDRMHAATLDHSQDIYDPVKNSCMSTLRDAINEVVPKHQRIPDHDVNAKVPVLAPKPYKKKDLIASTIPDIEYKPR